MTRERRDLAFATVPIGRHARHDYASPAPWRRDALCAQVGNPEQWFPGKGGSTAAQKKLCQSCVVRLECLEDALAHEAGDYVYGIRGGLNAPERSELLKARKRKGAA